MKIGQQSLNKSQIVEILKNLFLALIITMTIVLFLIQPVKVEGTSMQPLLKDQERVFINRISYKVFDINRGDVVVFNFPIDPSKSFIKRVIGLPGDTIQIIKGRVFVNGNFLQEPYVSKKYRDFSSFGPVKVPKDCYFVMGDHRNVSNDSRNWGFLPRNYIFGKAIIKYWPLDDMGIVH